MVDAIPPQYSRGVTLNQQLSIPNDKNLTKHTSYSNPYMHVLPHSPTRPAVGTTGQRRQVDAPTGPGCTPECQSNRCGRPTLEIEDYASGMAESSDLVDQYLEALAAGELEAVVGLYSDDARIVSFEGVAEGPEQIRALISEFLSPYDRFDLVSIDQLQATSDLITWDATMETGAGLMQVTNVIVLDGEGKIVRHVPSIRGFWGKT